MKKYPEEKREILAARSVDDLIEYLKDIKGKSALNLQQMLTPPKGFSENKKLKQNTLYIFFKDFVSNLKQESEISNTDSNIWNKFGRAFVWWVEAHPELFNILSDFKNEEDFIDNKCVEPNSPLDIKCFKVLRDASRKLQINQATIQRFYQYGYFIEDKRIEDIINKALTQEEIEHNQRLSELPDEVDELSQTIEDLNSRVSAVESANELKQELGKQITGVSEIFEENLQKLNQQITEVGESLDTRISELESSSIKTSELTKQVNFLKSQLSNLKKSVNTLEDKRQTTESPRIAYQAVEIVKITASIVKDKKNWKNEKNYIEEFGIPLWRLDITDSMDSNETKAIHVALKAFSVIEINDPRIIDAWKAACGNNLHVTTLDVGLGWLDTQDWFPSYFSVKCFGEELRLIDLDASVEEMFTTGNQLWVIDIRNCDRSYPESYLPDFLRWIDKHKNYAKVFLTRCLGKNCCNTSFEVYNEVGQLPKPAKPVSIKPKSVPIAKSIIIKPIWKKWCQPADEKLYQIEIQFLDKLQSEIENIPLSLLQDIQSYLLLSHQIFDPDKALDWALYLRLYPWLAGRNEIEDKLFNFIHQSDTQLPRTKAALQGNQ